MAEQERYQKLADRDAGKPLPPLFDRWDFLAAAGAGAVSGLVDIFFVDMPGKSSVLGGWADELTDRAVLSFAKMQGWTPRAGQENNVASAIGFFERQYPVNYDATSSVDVRGMAAKNHHIFSLGHAPDLTGLFFSILDQFTGRAHFIGTDGLISVSTENSGFRLQGGNWMAKLFCGIGNWLFHLISDVAGSSGSRGNGGRGTGIPVPFMEWLRMLHIGTFQVENDRNDLAMVMTKVFQKGYDFRFGMAMAVPVCINELCIRLFWILCQHYQYGRSWKECLKGGMGDTEHGLRIMLLVGYGTLCVMDGADAAIRSGGNAVLFFLRLNIWAWLRFLILVLKELWHLFGKAMLAVLKAYIGKIREDLGLVSEKQLLMAYRQRIGTLDSQLERLLETFEREIDETKNAILEQLAIVGNRAAGNAKRIQAGIQAAALCGVDDQDIIKSDKDLDHYFNS